MRLRGQNGPLEQSCEEARRLVVVERRQGERGRVRLSPAPAGAAREQLRSRGAHDEDRHTSCPVDQVVDEVEEPLVRPVEILEDEDERALFGDAFEESPPGGERLRPPVSVQLLLALDSDERAEVPLDPLGFGVVNHLTHAGSQLAFGLVGRIRLEDPCLGLDDFSESPVRDPFAVRKRAPLAPVDDLGIRLDSLEELVDEAALADAGYPDERHELRIALCAHAAECIREHVQLPLAPDQGRLRKLRGVDSVP